MICWHGMALSRSLAIIPASAPPSPSHFGGSLLEPVLSSQPMNRTSPTPAALVVPTAGRSAGEQLGPVAPIQGDRQHGCAREDRDVRYAPRSSWAFRFR